MPVLLVTNDFPPTVGGIQSYLRDFADEFVRRAGPNELIVFASTQDADAARCWDAEVDYTVVRWPRRVMLPTPATAREMRRLIRAHGVATVWFGAAAPLALMGAAAKSAGAKRVVASTHGHEVGWSMLPGARQVLTAIGRRADVVTYISEYALGRFRSAVGSSPRFVALPSGVDKQFFRPASEAERAAVRAELGVRGPLIVCASRLVRRKGQDTLLDALPNVLSAHPGARLVIVGTGPYERALKERAKGLGDAVVFTGAVDRTRLRDIVAAADVFAMPARTRGAGLDVEGLGIVYLEAQACAVPVVVGDSGGAPETVTDQTGIVVDGRDANAVAAAIVSLLDDPARRREMGRRGRAHVERAFSWEALGDRLYSLLCLAG
ncbi:glycosyltransferase family 4 protein [Corynebacterium sanguinis]|uniref:phosphatidyl-myo-inositol dimannoside synthase n=1 Tax=Corynebacterium sanguinis TaxID=2594913 RepID=A0A6C1TZI7_9CORY|nr:glycosyltransferase family 4 protein [Corynebacterium sanguinis]MCT1554947.1 glycosyltransferase family 4 protein [Corynebacterium sanguinis]MCT1583721.1 glycosyltransferase family 4 protein [Corynebacterium sanguinis]MCT1663028.1 glycosyltransferase family 4 protein [Corynebacterium sanguinis]MCT2023219.1 glycosyltransferase family 4 protein [Corynebacterium sanguinis]MCT2046197.1 glycosyltransferase family 4 protein [Corynebacterium sanguinis]